MQHYSQCRRIEVDQASMSMMRQHLIGQWESLVRSTVIQLCENNYNYSDIMYAEYELYSDIVYAEYELYSDIVYAEYELYIV